MNYKDIARSIIDGSCPDSMLKELRADDSFSLFFFIKECRHFGLLSDDELVSFCRDFAALNDMDERDCFLKWSLDLQRLGAE